jgi:hypothetical protein
MPPASDISGRHRIGPFISAPDWFRLRLAFFHSGTGLQNAGQSGILAIKKNCTKVEENTLHVHAAGYEKAYKHPGVHTIDLWKGKQGHVQTAGNRDGCTSTLLSVWMDSDTTCTSTLLSVWMDSPCTSIKLVVVEKRDTPCTSTLLEVESNAPYTFIHCVCTVLVLFCVYLSTDVENQKQLPERWAIS